MKKLLVTMLTGLIAVSAPALAQETKTLTSAADAIYGAGTLGQGRPISGQSTITSPAQMVYQAGANNADNPPSFKLESGHYYIGSEDGRSNKQYSLFINPSANNPHRYVALFVDNSVFHDESGQAKIMMGKPTNNGRYIQFSPVKIGMRGQIEDTADEGKGRVLWISKKLDPEDSYFPYSVKGLNGALGQELMGMEGAKSNMDLRVSPIKNIFKWENSRKNKIVVEGSLMTEYNPGVKQADYELFNLNGDFGAFYALTTTACDTGSTECGSKTGTEKFAVFLSEAGARQSTPQDCMMVLEPSSTQGDSFAVKLYAPQERLNWLQKLFGGKGRLTPKKAKGSFYSPGNHGGIRNNPHDPNYNFN